MKKCRIIGGHIDMPCLAKCCDIKTNPGSQIEKRQVRIVLLMVSSSCPNADFSRSLIRPPTSSIVARHARSFMVCMTRLACITA
jgi:hypothetical protein